MGRGQQGGGFQNYGSDKFLLSAKSYEQRTDDCCSQCNSLHFIIWSSEDKCTELCNQKYKGQLGCQLQVNLRKIVRQLLNKMEKIFL